MTYKATKDLHDNELTVRLTDKQLKMIEAMADFYDAPKAVVARKLIHQGLSEPVRDQGIAECLSA